jgi:hypothetical protein
LITKLNRSFSIEQQLTQVVKKLVVEAK